ncbi:MAG: hypothetical protein U5R31_08405 [Acidimicrobiia bacterium]|nr:hypothetical protein [Acidimicrobiia bacterium]
MHQIATGHPVDLVQVGQRDAVGFGEDPVHQLAADVGGHPARGTVVGGSPTAPLVLHRVEAHLGGLDAERGVVGDDRRGPFPRLAECRRQDPVVGRGRIESLRVEGLDHQTVGLDAQRPTTGQRDGRPDVAAVRHSQLLERADHLSCGAPDVVEPRLGGCRFLDDRQA